MSLTTDPNDPNLRKLRPNGQQESYLVLSDEERAKGFVNPIFGSYRHLKCGSVTTMGSELCETYARNPKFYGGTFCCVCGTHFPLVDDEGKRTFVWITSAGSEARKLDNTLFGVGEYRYPEHNI